MRAQMSANGISGRWLSGGGTSAIWLNAGFNCVRQTVMGGRVNSRWLQAQDLNLHLDTRMAQRGSLFIHGSDGALPCAMGPKHLCKRASSQTRLRADVVFLSSPEVGMTEQIPDSQYILWI